MLSPDDCHRGANPTLRSSRERTGSGGVETHRRRTRGDGPVRAMIRLFVETSSPLALLPPSRELKAT